MKVLLNSAAYRIAFVTSLAFALATLLLGAAVFYAAHAALARQLDASIEQASGSIMAELGDDGLNGLIEAVRQREMRAPDALGFALFDPNGRRIAGQMNTTRPATGWHRIIFIDPREGPDPARALTTQLAGGYQLVVAADLEPLEEIDARILELFSTACLGLLIIGILGALALGAYLRRRLVRIQKTAEAIVSGDLKQRMLLGPRNDEFDRVAQSLNTMLDRIEALVVNLRQVTSDLAHDLRTPLARLRNQLDKLGSSRSDQERSRIADEAVERADEVLRLFDAILRISELEEGSLSERFGPVDLGALVEELGEMHAPIAEDEGRTLITATRPGCIVTGDRELIAQALINLIENALRHTPVGSRIWLGVALSDGHPTAYVWDNGHGIPQQDRERVFERFVRLETSRSTPGHGLGLSLVKAIARVHNATVSITDAEPGLKVALHFPPEAA